LLDEFAVLSKKGVTLNNKHVRERGSKVKERGDSRRK